MSSALPSPCIYQKPIWGSVAHFVISTESQVLVFYQAVRFNILRCFAVSVFGYINGYKEAFQRENRFDGKSLKKRKKINATFS